MKLIADLHIHSHFSIATSKQLIPEYLDLWARIKGINIIGTGDFTHPSWIDELEEKLEPAEEGLYRLRDEYRIDSDWGLPGGFGDPVRFLLSAEISNIYKRDKKVRKVHNVVFAPDFAAVRKIQAGLARRKFNITSDGRPILGLDCRDLLELVLDISEKTFFIPAHIWTPWFSALGAKSGFDTIEECYGDLSSHIHAVETGLSSDPAMNWMCGFLDRYTLVSNSDAHSPEKLGREANILDAELSYHGITSAIASGRPERFLGTIEFFPQEGKYHYDGHRKCGVCWDPLENLKSGGICTGCGKPVTMGVMSRIAQLSDRDDILEREVRPPFHSIIPLKEILAEILEVGPGSSKVEAAYRRTICNAGAEFTLLLDTGMEPLEQAGGALLAEAIRRMRAGEVYISEGYDGEFGVIRLFDRDEIRRMGRSESLFIETPSVESRKPEPRLLRFSLSDYRELADSLAEKVPLVAEPGGLFELVGQAPGSAEEGGGETGGTDKGGQVLNREQQLAVEYGSGPLMVIAGPGTGKTQVLTRRVLHLASHEGIDPGRILAVTFTNKAAEEMSRRISAALGPESGVPEVATFHALGYRIIRRNLTETGRSEGFALIDQDEQASVISGLAGCGASRARALREGISRMRQGVAGRESGQDPEAAEVLPHYLQWLRERNLFDLDDLIVEAVRLLEEYEEIRNFWRDRFSRVLVDEFQDINQAQYRMLRLLCPDPGSSICVIGDPDQAIYGFRGSDVGFMKTFREDYPSAGVYSLKRSYRCTDTILRASSEVLNEGSGDRSLQGLSRGVRIRISRQVSDRSEAEFTARTIEEMVGGLRSFSMYSRISAGEEAESIGSLSDFAVLCRTARQMDLFEEAFHNHAVPYQRVGGGGFLEAPAVRRILDCLNCLRNPGNDYFRGKLGDMADRIAAGLTAPGPGTEVARFLKDLAGNCIPESQDDPAVLQLFEFSTGFGENFESFYHFLDLGSEPDLYRDSSESVALMTIHAAKGLEFECVFIPGCEEGILPFRFPGSEDVDLDEERRIFYVGMTRARRYLFLTHAASRFVFGRKAERRRSPFLDAIEARLIEELRAEERQKPEKREDRQLKLF